MAGQQKNQDMNQLLQVRRDKLADLQGRGKDPFQITKYDVTNHTTDIINQYEEFEGKTVRLAGRMMFKRVMGKASFCNIQDLPGSIQCYVARDTVGEEPYADFKKYDIGDIIGIRGVVFKTGVQCDLSGVFHLQALHLGLEGGLFFLGRAPVLAVHRSVRAYAQ